MKSKTKVKDPKDLRHGYTTGANATAATKAALTALITGEEQTEATIYLPVGQFVTFQMESCECTGDTAVTGVIKDGGDDPDATHGALIRSTVTWSHTPGITLDGGVGVGRVTKEGLPVPVGQAAINPVPRRMIHQVAKEVLEQYSVDKGIKIVISVPDGEEIAKKTLNGRLGIVGGISILGTRGIVVPFSTSAYKASIAYAIEVAKQSGCDHVVITTGGRSEKYGIEQYPHLPKEAFIEMGDFVGFTLKQCKRKGIRKVSMVGMMGKFSKVAQGIMNVHSKSAPVDFDFIANVAEEAGVQGTLLEEVRQANTATQAGQFILEHGYNTFFEKICDRCCRSALQETGGGLEIETSLYTLKGTFLGKAVRHGTED
ncbi:cobalt-precorrin-5B (C(1))-methyltransferase [Melghirimyces algeriensis]|uniref:Cobalt-precorrin-5B C(1)-methyltransferase n=1 Tax=Melghirimyces algeriensis TaxID=910412 RepID=A0A521F365_9BACL|nr:cobalt-precorrin-5B (C(1))-methyltransferase [Melghirimyces algeriensis]SMO90615.1 cobalt-precorrin 5B C1-methyltransferase [Melghirimyces algeriensis]